MSPKHKCASARGCITGHRDDFWAHTSNKQLNFLQHVKSCLRIHGRAAIVVPDNVLFKGGAGETVKRELLKQCDVHALRCQQAFCMQGVKANVLFFDRKPASQTPQNDFRTNEHFTLKTTMAQHQRRKNEMPSRMIESPMHGANRFRTDMTVGVAARKQPPLTGRLLIFFQSLKRFES